MIQNIQYSSTEKYSSQQERSEQILPKVASGRTFSYNPLPNKPVSMLGHNPPWSWRGNYADPNGLWIGFALKKDENGGFWQFDLACHIYAMGSSGFAGHTEPAPNETEEGIRRQPCCQLCMDWQVIDECHARTMIQNSQRLRTNSWIFAF